MSRRQAREIALQTLFQLDMNPIDDGADVSKARQAAIEVAVSAADEAVKLSSNDKKFLLELVNGTECNLEEIDKIISDKSKEWKLNRMMGVDRSITRMAVYELKFREEKLTPNIIINEAVELAKKFGTDESSRFVNGILGAIARG
ncbi:transcription antitermination factor NusB [Anaerovibrio sp.]|uniref:transcription antitermination factor NusB n=1 Tax=Anaerovibrio sp. TaxID=1872532 RepID=UPI0025BDB195|nr:transcription antitermination factor NusB [Anaerovibrio sp.]MBR2143446.1 transcription antitermination factor NusB [Anaerovibrio sp.]